MLDESFMVEARAAAESLMVDACVVRRKTGNSAQDETTMAETPVYETRFKSPCKIQARGLSDISSRGSSVAGEEGGIVSQAIHLPIGMPAVNRGDLIEITAVGLSSDAQMVGRKFRVVAPASKTFATARRFEVEDVV